jgi:hypothetical protein
VDGALGAGAGGQVDAADDAGRDPDGCLFQAGQYLQVEVSAQDELDVGPTDCVGQFCAVLQAERLLNVDVLIIFGTSYFLDDTGWIQIQLDIG